MKTVKVTPTTLQQMKERGEKIVQLPVYDYPFAKILDECGVDVLLVGDSLGTVVLGMKDDLSVTVDDMIHHTLAVVRAAERAMVVADMPFMSYCDINEAKKNAGRLMKEGRADAVKLEGGAEMADTIRALVKCGIPVMAHIGMLDQSYKLTGVFRVTGRTPEDREKLLRDAKAVEEAGAFSVGLDCMTADIAAEISKSLKIPTNGVGAGPYCDGCGSNAYDIWGLTVGFHAKFTKRYVNVRDIMSDAIRQFVKEVKEGSFPDDEHSYH